MHCNCRLVCFVMGNQPGVFKSVFSPRIKSGHIRIMVFLNVKEIDKRCTTISGNAAIPRCGGELVFLINSLLDTARNSLATKSYCFLLFSLAGIAQAWGLRTGYQSHVKKTSLSPCEQKEWLIEQAEMDLGTAACTVQQINLPAAACVMF